MAKMVISLGWQKYVVDAKQAVAIAEILNSAELYEAQSKKNEEGNYVTTYHVYDNPEERWVMELMSDNIYRVAKLAGKPEKD
jgi:transposase